MKKRMLALLLTLVMVVAMLPVTAMAVDTLPDAENGVIKLTDNVTLSDIEEPSESITLDLNGHILTLPRLNAADGVTVTVIDSSEKKDGKITSSGGNTCAVFSGGTLILEAGTIENTSDGGNAVFNMGTLTVKGGTVKGETGVYNTAWNGQTAVTGNIVCNIEGGTVDAEIWGVCVMGPGIENGDLSTVDNSKLVVNISGGTIIAEQGIAGNASSGTRAGFTVNMTAGEIKDHAGAGTGMYLPSIGVTNIYGGSVTAAQAIRICAGELNVTGGTITCTALGNGEDLIAGGSGGTTGAIVVGKAGNGYVGDIKVNVSGSAVIENTAKGSDRDIYPTVVVSDKNMAQTSDQSFKDPATGSNTSETFKYSETATSVVVNAQVKGDIVKISNVTQSTSTSDGGNTSLDITGGTVTGNVINQTTAGDLNVAGATVNGDVKNDSDGAVVISDGAKIDGDVSSFKSGNVAILNSTVTGAAPNNATIINSTVDNKEHAGDNYVALMNGKGYDSLQAAVNAVTTPDETTIKLLKSTAGSGVKVDGTVARNLTFDLGGHTYTVNSGVGSTGTETNGFQLIKDNNITIKNGTIAADTTSANIYFLIQNYSNLTLENVTLDGTGLKDYYSQNYTLSNNNGVIALNSGTKIIPRTADDIAMDVCWAASYEDGARVTVEEGAEIQGNVELGLWNQEAYEGNQSVLTVNGGTITGDLTIGKQTSSDDELQQVVEDLKPNITINGGSFGASVDKFIDDKDGAAAKVQSGDTHSYYTSMEAALAAAQQGDSVTDLNTTSGNPVTLTLKYNDGVSADSVYTVETGTPITLPTPTRSGYRFVNWTDGTNTYDGGDTYEVTAAAILTAQWSAISSGSTSYAITVSSAANGKVAVSTTRASKNATVTITVTPDKGYVLDTLTVTDANGKTVSLTKVSDTKYTFKMPASKVTVKAAFAKEALPFTDVTGHWALDAITYVYENGMMNGVTTTKFGPETELTRGMIVTILYRLEGEPNVSGSDFADVASSQYYADPVAWAAKNGIVTGYPDGTFGPEKSITREQLAAILYRYAQYKDYDVSVGEDTNILSYLDVADVSEYAISAFQWACGSGVITGVTESTLVPQGTATRAQVATMLMRFCETVAK